MLVILTIYPFTHTIIHVYKYEIRILSRIYVSTIIENVKLFLYLWQPRKVREFYVK